MITSFTHLAATCLTAVLCLTVAKLEDSYPGMRARLQRFPLLGMVGGRRPQQALRNALKQAIKEQDADKYEATLLQSTYMYPHMQALLLPNTRCDTVVCGDDNDCAAAEENDLDCADTRHARAQRREGRSPASSSSSVRDLVRMRINSIDTDSQQSSPMNRSHDAAQDEEGGAMHLSGAGAPSTTAISMATSDSRSALLEDGGERDELWPFVAAEIEQHNCSRSPEAPGGAANTDAGDAGDSQSAVTGAASSGFHCSACNYTAQDCPNQKANWMRHLKAQTHLDRQTSPPSSQTSSILAYFPKVARERTEESASGSGPTSAAGKRRKLDKEAGSSCSPPLVEAGDAIQTPSPPEVPSPPEGAYTGISASSEGSSDSVKYKHFSTKQFLY
jgi:hypothetical protein